MLSRLGRAFWKVDWPSFNSFQPSQGILDLSNIYRVKDACTRDPGHPNQFPFINTWYSLALYPQDRVQFYASWVFITVFISNRVPTTKRPPFFQAGDQDLKLSPSTPPLECGHPHSQNLEPKAPVSALYPDLPSHCSIYSWYWPFVHRPLEGISHLSMLKVLVSSRLPSAQPLSALFLLCWTL